MTESVRTDVPYHNEPCREPLTGTPEWPAWLPVPVMAVVILICWAAGEQAGHETPGMTIWVNLLWLNLLFSTSASLAVAVLLGWSFYRMPSPGLLIIGCSVFIWGVGSFVAPLAGQDVNARIGMHNICMWIAACGHLAGALASKRQCRPGSPVLWLMAAHAGALLIIGGVAWSVRHGMFPDFFIPGRGGTLPRQFLLGSAILLLGLAAAILRPSSGGARFCRLYRIGLLMLAVGLVGIMLLSTIGSALGWAGRIAQFLGGLYMIAAVLSVLKGNRIRPLALGAGWKLPWQRCLFAIAIVVTAAAIKFVFLHWLESKAPYVVFFPAMTIIALYAGLWPTMVASLLSAVLVDYFWIWPAGTVLSSPEELLLASVFVGTSAISAGVTEAMRRAQVRAHQAETQAGIAEATIRAKHALERERDLLQAVMDGARNFHLVYLDRDFNFVRVNETYARACGYLPGEMVGRNHFDLYPHPENEALFRQARDTGLPVEVRDKPFCYPDRPELGVSYWDWTLTPVRDANDAVTGLVFSLLETTDRKRTEDELQHLNQSLEQRVAERTAELREKDRLLLQQNRMAAMGEMLNNIAHQWRQPLNTLGLTVQRLAILYGAGAFTKEALDGCVADSMRLILHMSRTIDDFRDFFRPDKEKSEFAVNEAIGQTLALVDDSFVHNRIRVVTEIGEEWRTFGYPNEFSQALLNILQNARDVILERKVGAGVITVVSAGWNGRGVIRVTDNGGGIPQEIIGKIFEPYFSTKGLQGTGIGLYMSKVIIENNMGGRLSVRNVAEGAEFVIEV